MCQYVPPHVAGNITNMTTCNLIYQGYMFAPKTDTKVRTDYATYLFNEKAKGNTTKSKTTRVLKER